MDQYVQTPVVQLVGKQAQKLKLTLRLMAFLFCFFPGLKAFSQQPNKIQNEINAIKQAYYCEDQDYHTDGERTVWVKSYKKWEPADLAVMKKESPAILRFLGMAVQRARYDVLDQLLPNYYREHGGVKAFATDIVREEEAPQPQE